MSFSSEDYKVIAWYARENGVVPQLSTYPDVRFKGDDGIVTINLTEVRDEYIAWKTEDQRVRRNERARERRAEREAERREAA
jgi:hypothetical protein